MKQPELEHVQLCDLLIGRSLRLHAKQRFELAEKNETYAPGARYFVNVHLDSAAHMEWIASIAEQGLVRWGGRFNRCGYQPAEDERRPGSRHHWETLI